MGSDAASGEKTDWRNHGLRIIRSGELSTDTAQTVGMTRRKRSPMLASARKKLWAGTVVVHPDAKTGPHHHGELEPSSMLFGAARDFAGRPPEFVDEARPGDFVYVPPYVPHQELNRQKGRAGEAVIVPQRAGAGGRESDIPSPEEKSRYAAARSFPFRSRKS